MNSSVLVIGDLHFPYHHKDALDFVAALCKRYTPDRIIQIGDETDGHSISFHDHDPDLDSPGPEFDRAERHLHDFRDVVGDRVDLLESNHGSLVWRKGLTAGLPKRVFKPMHEIWNLPKTWQWHFDIKLELCNGEQVYFHHGKTANVMRLSQAMGMSAIQGHYHELHGCNYWGTPGGLHFAAQTGCLIDWHSMAMAYAKNNLKRPVLGSLVILDGLAFTVPMVLGKTGRWIKTLPRKLNYVKIR